MCSYSLPELEPRLFSFNNPMGACPRCDGLGAITFFDPKRVVSCPHLSLGSYWQTIVRGGFLLAVVLLQARLAHRPGRPVRA